MISTGKICATVAGLAAVILVISQLQMNNSKDDVVENWLVSGPMLRPNTMTTARGVPQRGKSLLSDLPDSVFFQPTASYQPRTVIGAN